MSDFGFTHVTLPDSQEIERSLIQQAADAWITGDMARRTTQLSSIFQDGRIRRWREYIDTQSCMRPTT